ncbi:MAG: pantoate--beta-alanine ligase, partial [Acidobacteriota bacterium]
RRLEEESVLQLEAAGFAVEHVEAVDARTMRRVEAVAPGVALTAAVRLGKTRLIDNVFLQESDSPDQSWSPGRNPER